MAGTVWRDWDGRRLVWDRGDAEGALELCIDGVTFARFPATAPARGECVFEYAPSGCAEMEFTLRHPGAAPLAAPWRVVFDRAAPPGVDQWQGPLHAMRSLASPPLPQPGVVPVSIVVPIYNAPQLVGRCIDSVLRYTRAPARLILIDDASPDPDVSTLLQRYLGDARIVVQRNGHNAGYTRSTNLGIELAARDDVVLLNSDTEVGPGWLDALRAIACADAQVGTVTAVSDNAGAFSVPELEQYCPIPAQWSLPQTQRAMLHNMHGCLPELPTGNGFCMYVKRALLDRVGVLDAAAFPAGYGEENDLCQRAERVGYRHLIAGNVLVRHARSASFGDERRAALGAQGMAVLRERYPDYEAKVGATLWSFARRVLDYRVRRLYADHDHRYAALPPRPRLSLAGEAAAFAPALRGAFDCRTLTHGANDAVVLRALLIEHAIEFVHTHGIDAGPLREAVHGSGIALIDSTPDAALSPAKAASLPLPQILAYCTQLYRAAWCEGAAFPAHCDGGFA